MWCCCQSYWVRLSGVGGLKSNFFSVDCRKSISDYQGNPMRIFKIQTVLSLLGLFYIIYRFGFNEILSLTFFFIFFLLSLAGLLFGSRSEE